MAGKEKGGRIVFATGNEDKMREVRMILGDMGWEVVSMKEAGANPDIREDGATFEENALIKARAVHAVCQGLVLADDSGLEIDWLGGEPGVHSSRYLGEDTSYEIKNRVILERMEGVVGTDRSARFVCAIAAVLPDGRELTVRGTVEGRIAHEPAGQGGFGYDPIFYVEELGKTTAQLSDREKNEISHRGRALRKMRTRLEELG